MSLFIESQTFCWPYFKNVDNEQCSNWDVFLLIIWEFIMAKAKVDPDTGYTPAQQQKRWNAVFNQVQKEMDTTTKTKRKMSVRQPKSDNQLKGQAIDMFKAGKSVKDVSTELNITYANAYYYSRFAK